MRDPFHITSHHLILLLDTYIDWLDSMEGQTFVFFVLVFKKKQLYEEYNTGLSFNDL